MTSEQMGRLVSAESEMRWKRMDDGLERLKCSAELDKWEAERFDEDARDALAARYANRCSDSRVKLEKILGSWYVTAGPGSAAAHASDAGTGREGHRPSAGPSRLSGGGSGRRRPRVRPMISVRFVQALFPFSEFRAESREPYVTSLDVTSEADQWLLVLNSKCYAPRRAGPDTGTARRPARAVLYADGRGWVGGSAWARAGIPNSPTKSGTTWACVTLRAGGRWMSIRSSPTRTGASASGYDFRYGSLVSPASRRDIMGYCYEQGWLSDYYFEKVIDYRKRVEGTAPRMVAADRGQPRDMLVLWGGVLNGKMRLEPPFTIGAAPQLPNEAGPYRIEATGMDGGIDIDLSFRACEDQFGDRYFFFTVSVEADWADTLDRITLTGPGGLVTVAADHERTLTIVSDPSTGWIQALLHDLGDVPAGGSGGGSRRRDGARAQGSRWAAPVIRYPGKVCSIGIPAAQYVP